MEELKARSAHLPVCIVTKASQLPRAFLQPSPETKLVIGFDCEGVHLSQHGRLCLMQLAFEDGVHLVDAVEGGNLLMEACKPALESVHVTKVVHDCKRDSEALYFQHGIKLNNVFDTQIAYSLILQQEGRKRPPDNKHISLVDLLNEYCGVKFPEKELVRTQLKEDPNLWKQRPLTRLMQKSAADDVRYLFYIYKKMFGKLEPLSRWRLAVRGSMYCRCFCVNNNNNNLNDSPTLPPLPDDLINGGHTPEEEILQVIDVPGDSMKHVIGKQGASIKVIRNSCEAEIFLRGKPGGSPTKACIIGARNDVNLAAEFIRRKMD